MESFGRHIPVDEGSAHRDTRQDTSWEVRQRVLEYFLPTDPNLQEYDASGNACACCHCYRKLGFERRVARYVICYFALGGPRAPIPKAAPTVERLLTTSDVDCGESARPDVGQRTVTNSILSSSLAWPQFKEHAAILRMRTNHAYWRYICWSDLLYIVLCDKFPLQRDVRDETFTFDPRPAFRVALPQASTREEAARWVEVLKVLQTMEEEESKVSVVKISSQSLRVALFLSPFKRPCPPPPRLPDATAAPMEYVCPTNARVAICIFRFRVTEHLKHSDTAPVTA